MTNGTVAQTAGWGRTSRGRANLHRRLLAVLIFFLAVQPASAQLDQLLKGLGIGQQSGLSEAKVGSGLKEALKIGTENSVKLTGRVDGYLTNLVIKLTIHGALGGRLEVSDA